MSKKVRTRVTRVNLQVSPTQLKTIYILKPGRGREEKTQKSWQNMGKIRQMGLSQGEVCFVDRKCLFGIVFKVSFSACVPEARGKSLTIFKDKFDAL